MKNKKIPELEAIVLEINKQTPSQVTYWCPDDEDRNPYTEHIWAVASINVPKIAGIKQDLIYVGASGLIQCGHTHHVVQLEGTILEIGDCLKVDLNDPMSIPVIIQFYTPIVSDVGRQQRTGHSGWGDLGDL